MTRLQGRALLILWLLCVKPVVVPSKRDVSDVYVQNSLDGTMDLTQVQDEEGVLGDREVEETSVGVPLAVTSAEAKEIGQHNMQNLKLDKISKQNLSQGHSPAAMTATMKDIAPHNTEKLEMGVSSKDELHNGHPVIQGSPVIPKAEAAIEAKKITEHNMLSLEPEMSSNQKSLMNTRVAKSTSEAWQAEEESADKLEMELSSKDGLHRGPPVIQGSPVTPLAEAAIEAKKITEHNMLSLEPEMSSNQASLMNATAAKSTSEAWHVEEKTGSAPGHYAWLMGAASGKSPYAVLENEVNIYGWSPVSRDQQVIITGDQIGAFGNGVGAAKMKACRQGLKKDANGFWSHSDACATMPLRGVFGPNAFIGGIWGIEWKMNDPASMAFGFGFIPFEEPSGDKVWLMFALPNPNRYNPGDDTEAGTQPKPVDDTLTRKVKLRIETPERGDIGFYSTNLNGTCKKFVYPYQYTSNDGVYSTAYNDQYAANSFGKHCDFLDKWKAKKKTMKYEAKGAASVDSTPVPLAITREKQKKVVAFVQEWNTYGQAHKGLERHDKKTGTTFFNNYGPKKKYCNYASGFKAQNCQEGGAFPLCCLKNVASIAKLANPRQPANLLTNCQEQCADNTARRIAIDYLIPCAALQQDYSQTNNGCAYNTLPDPEGPETLKYPLVIKRNPSKEARDQVLFASLAFIAFYKGKLEEKWAADAAEAAD